MKCGVDDECFIIDSGVDMDCSLIPDSVDGLLYGVEVGGVPSRCGMVVIIVNVDDRYGCSHEGVVVCVATARDGIGCVADAVTIGVNAIVVVPIIAPGGVPVVPNIITLIIRILTIVFKMIVIKGVIIAGRN